MTELVANEDLIKRKRGQGLVNSNLEQQVMVNDQVENKSQIPLISASQPAQTQEVAPQIQEIAPQTPMRGMLQEAQAEDRLGQKQARAISDAQKTIEMQEAEIAQERQKVQEEIQNKIKEIESFEIKPRNFFENKSTAEKIMAGVGLYLSAFTPQSAQNAVNIIQNEIERDLSVQKANLEKKRNTLSLLQEKLGSLSAAETAFRKKALDNLQLKLQEFQQASKGEFAKAKYQQAIDLVEQQKEALSLKLLSDLEKKEKENQGLAINAFGYVGIAPDKESARKFRETLADAASVKRGIQDLIGLAESGSSLSLEDREKAKITANMLKAKLRTQILGPGAVTDAERKILDNIVANPLELTRLSSTAKVALNTLQKKIDQSIDDQAQTIGVINTLKKFEKYKK